jgi:hypothetical protein
MQRATRSSLWLTPTDEEALLVCRGVQSAFDVRCLLPVDRRCEFWLEPRPGLVAAMTLSWRVAAD